MNQQPEFPHVTLPTAENFHRDKFILHRKGEEPLVLCALELDRRATDESFQGIPVPLLRVMYKAAIAEDDLRIAREKFPLPPEPTAKEKLDEHLTKRQEAYEDAVIDAANKWAAIQNSFFELAKRAGVGGPVEAVLPTVMNMLDSQNKKIEQLRMLNSEWSQQVTDAKGRHSDAFVRITEMDKRIEAMTGMPYDKGGKERLDVWIEDAAQRQKEGPRTFLQELASLINRFSLEKTAGNTPDFMIAEFLLHQLHGLGTLVNERAKWYGRGDAPGRGSYDIPEKVDACSDPSCVKCQDDTPTESPEQFTERALLEGITALAGSKAVLGDIANISHAIDMLEKLRAMTKSENDFSGGNVQALG